jgi:hypothetical protein
MGRICGLSGRRLMLPHWQVHLEARKVLSQRPLLIVTLEGLAVSALGCYGSAWNSTPAIDAIAATGCVWDRLIAATDDPLGQFRRWISPTGQPDPLAPWKAAGSAELITDDPRLIDEGVGDGFDRVQQIRHLSPTTKDVATEIEQTHFGQLVAAAIERDARGAWDLLWLHSRFLTRSWDAPRQLSLVSAEEIITEPSEEVELLADPTANDEAPLAALPPWFATAEPPHVQLHRQSHPDLITSWMMTYGCQIRLVDLLLEVLLRSIREDDPQVILAGTSGMSLGQNGWIGPHAGPLRSCDLRLPLVVSDAGPMRSPHVTSADSLARIIPSLAADTTCLVSPTRWCEADGELDPCVDTETSRAAIARTTSRWQMVRDLDGTDHLFLKPDDVEDANDVGRLRRDIVDQLDAT